MTPGAATVKTAMIECSDLVAKVPISNNPRQYHIINTNPNAPYGSSYTSEYLLGLTTSCNSGNGIFSAWNTNFNGVNGIYYKHNGATYAFRPSSLNETKKEIATLSLFPNPSSGVLNLKCSDFKIEKLKIMNMLGQVVYVLDKYENQKELNISFLPSGNYILHAYSDNNHFIAKKFSISNN